MYTVLIRHFYEEVLTGKLCMYDHRIKSEVITKTLAKINYEIDMSVCIKAEIANERPDFSEEESNVIAIYDEEGIVTRITEYKVQRSMSENGWRVVLNVHLF